MESLYRFSCTLLGRGFRILSGLWREERKLYMILLVSWLVEDSLSFFFEEKRGKLYTDLLVPWLAQGSMFSPLKKRKKTSLQIYLYPASQRIPYLSTLKINYFSGHCWPHEDYKTCWYEYRCWRNRSKGRFNIKILNLCISW